MSKLPDLGKLAGKLDVEGLMENVKSMLNTDMRVSGAPDGDSVGKKLEEISALAHKLSDEHAKHTAELERLKSLVKSLYDELHPKVAAMKQAAPAAKPAEPAKEAPKAEEPPAEAHKKEE